MHIPDGFISPKMYIPAYTVSAGLWAYGARKVKKELDIETIPRLAVMTALAFVLMMIAVPLPGGTSAHATGIGLLAVLFGPWIAFLSISLVLLLQALLFGIGGITTLPINALAMGMAGGTVGAYSFRILRTHNCNAALFTAGWLSVTTAAALTAVALGVQPVIAHAGDGTPLFFPFGLRLTVPAVLIPHIIVGVGEGLLTILVYNFVEKFGIGSEA